MMRHRYTADQNVWCIARETTAVSDRQGPVENGDPRQALRTLIEGGEGTSASATMLRLMWLRQDHPAATVATEALQLSETMIAIRATIALPQGGHGSGIAAATVEDISDWAAEVERTETTAIARALDTLGYVLERANAMAPSSRPQQAAPQHAQPQPPATAPQQQSQTQPPQQQPSSQPQQMPRSITPPSRPTAVPRNDEAAPPVINALRRAQVRPESQQGPPAPTASAPRDDDAPLPEYSWTGFWNAARGFGLDAKRVEEILGRPANQSSPKEAVEALRAAGAWGAPDGAE